MATAARAAKDGSSGTYMRTATAARAVARNITERLGIPWGGVAYPAYAAHRIKQKMLARYMIMNEKTKDRIITYVIAIAIPLGVGALSALLTREGMELYSTITKPPLSPPAIVFPIAWTILYVLMGISSGMIWERRTDCAEAAIGLRNYAISLGLNFFWSIIFFNLGAFLFAFVWLLALTASVIATAVSYRRVYPPAALLQIPYILWLLFAAYLNLGVYVLN